MDDLYCKIEKAQNTGKSRRKEKSRGSTPDYLFLSLFPDTIGLKFKRQGKRFKNQFKIPILFNRVKYCEKTKLKSKIVCAHVRFVYANIAHYERQKYPH